MELMELHILSQVSGPGRDRLIPDTVPGAPGMVPLPHRGEDSTSLTVLS